MRPAASPLPRVPSPRNHTVEPTADFCPPFSAIMIGVSWNGSDVSAVFENGRCRSTKGPRKAQRCPEEASEQLWNHYSRTSLNLHVGWSKSPSVRDPKEILEEQCRSGVFIPQNELPMPRPRGGRMARGRQPSLHLRAWHKYKRSLPRSIGVGGRKTHWPKISRPMYPLPPAIATAHAKLYRARGPMTLNLMIVGSKPGDQEALAGGPSLVRGAAVLTDCGAGGGWATQGVLSPNAVSIFKFSPRGSGSCTNLHTGQRLSIAGGGWTAEIAQVVPNCCLGWGPPRRRA